VGYHTNTRAEATVPDTTIVTSFLGLLQGFAPCFTAPSFQTFLVLAAGWVLNLGRHTVTATIRSANAVGWKHFSSFHRFFAAASWRPDGVGVIVVRLVDRLVPKDQAVLVAIDDTLGRHTGKKISAASMHRDPLLSTGKRLYFHWGHLWVVAGIHIRVFDKSWCLPVLFRLYRGKKRCAAEKRPYRKTPELAAELIRVLAETLPHRRIVVVGDAAYTNRSVIRRRPGNVTVIGRCRLDAAIYEPPPRRAAGQMGRPRVRGAKLLSPEAQLASGKVRCQTLRLEVYGRTTTVKVFVIDALWYIAAGSELVRIVVVRDFPGHERDDVFVCTDPTMTAQAIVETFAHRWSLEVTFHEVKGKLGFEDPQNRTELAVERTAPFALWMYTFVALWYFTTGQRLRAARHLSMPWYRTKTTPAFSDMLATLRRASWSERLFDPRGNHSTSRKLLLPLLDHLSLVA
jgi:hypothetical protein